jgi:hypothetical protein
MRSDDGHEATVTDIVTLQKDSRCIAHLGLTLAEAKQLLAPLLLQTRVKTSNGELGCLFKPWYADMAVEEISDAVPSPALWFVSYRGGFPPDNVAQIPPKPLSIQHNDAKGSAT